MKRSFANETRWSDVPTDVEHLVERVELLRLDAGRHLNPGRRTALGQFMTPAPVCRLMAEMVRAGRTKVRLLDPGAGVGSLTAAWVAKVAQGKNRPSEIDLVVYEIDQQLASHGKMPDIVVHHTERNWLVLIEAVTSHGPVNAKRRGELKALFQGSSAGLVFVTTFLTRQGMVKYLSDISWETEVWVAESPSHLIHFNGERFLGPYSD